MKSISEIQKEIADLSAACTAIEMKAERENRSMTREELGLRAEMTGTIEALTKELPVGQPLTMPGGGNLLDQRRETTPNAGPYALVGPGGRKDYKALFGAGGPEWSDRETNFFAAVLSGRHHPGLIKNASMVESQPSDGGFLVPAEHSARIHAVSLESEIVQPRAFVQPMNSSECNIPALAIGDHSSSLYGGFTASYTAELSTLSEKNPKTRGMILNAKKLYGLIRFSSELAADTPGGMSQIETLCGRGLGWYRDKAFLKGSGAGEPLGILNAGCTVEVDPEDGQTENTIIWENLTKMASRMFAGSFGNSVWVAHQSTIPQLASLAVPVGLGGAYIPAMTEGGDGSFRILTKPVIFTEKTEPLGSRGDIMLCDFSQYVVGLRSGMRFDVSIHPGFLTDEIYARLIERHDGQPLWNEALTLEDGSTTVSPFVVLGER